MKLKNLFLGKRVMLLLMAFMLFIASSCTREVKSETNSPPDVITFTTKPILMKVVAPTGIQLPFELAKDKIKTFRFSAGDSVVTLTAAPNTDIFLEFSDTANGTADTFRVFIRTSPVAPVTSGLDVLAFLKRMNVIDTGQQIFTQGLVIPGDGVTIFFKMVYQYPSIIKVVRSSFFNTRNGDKVIIKAMTTPTGSIDVPELDNIAMLNKPGGGSEFTIKNKETVAIISQCSLITIAKKSFKYPLKL